MVKYLLTSAGISNPTIHGALGGHLGRPIAESRALCVPTGVHPFAGGAESAYRFIHGSARHPMCELGWASLGVLELTALPSVAEEVWTAAVREADALLVYGGDGAYLCRWMRASGLAGLLPSLAETVYVGVSAGSMLTAPKFGETYDDPTTPFVVDQGLGWVDFALVPHLDHEDHPESSTPKVARLAEALPVPHLRDRRRDRHRRGRGQAGGRLRGPLATLRAGGHAMILRVRVEDSAHPWTGAIDVEHAGRSGARRGEAPPSGAGP